MAKWLKSRTINWAGIIAAFGALQAALPTLQDFIPKDVYAYLFVAIGVLMAYLRVTHRPIE